MNCEFWVPVATVIGSNGKLDKEGNVKVWNNIIENGLDGIVVLGSTGEFSVMTESERKELVLLAVENVPHEKLIIGTGCQSIDDTINFSNFALSLGVKGVMIVSPYYFALTQEDVYNFYDLIAQEVKGDIYLYNYPDRTVHDVSPEVALRLALKHKNIIGYKDSVGSMSHTRELIGSIKSIRPEFKIYCGLDENFAHNILSGGDGVVGGFGNIAPEICAAWRDAIKSNDINEISNYQKLINHCVQIYTQTNPYVPAVKTAMKLRGIIDYDNCITPMGCTTPLQTEKITTILKKANLI